MNVQDTKYNSLEVAKVVDFSKFGEIEDKAEHLRITDTTDLPILAPVIKLGDAIIATAGDTVMFSGAEKSGKTAASQVVIVGCIAPGEYDGFPQMHVQSNVNEKAVIHIETEQSKWRHQYIVRANIRRAGLTFTPDFYRSYNFVQLPLEEYILKTKEVCDFAVKKFGGIHMIVIDGGADFIADVMDGPTSTDLVKFQTGLAAEYNTVVIVIVHTNYGSEKERGHYGSQMRRKCASALYIKQEDGISSITPALLRHAGKSDVPIIQFRYDKDKGYHTYNGEAPKVEKIDQDEKNAKRISDIKKIALVVFAPPSSLAYKEAIDRIMAASKKALITSKGMFTEMKAHSMIIQGPDSLWRLLV